MTGVAILGSTGSIGRSTLAVLSRHPDRFQAVALAANRSVDLLADQLRAHGVRLVGLGDERGVESLRSRVAEGVRVVGGQQGILEVATSPEADVVVNALVGAAGLEASIAVLEHGKRLALANKESLVAAGPVVLAAAERGGGELVPVDSEHSAILQCITGYDRASVSRVVLTASGGPFREWSSERMDAVTPAQALRHPTWEMGAKITIDSATLANKALEVVEAHYLFGLPYDDIEVVVHPQSIVHSFVEFNDGSVLAQVGHPTMEIPILYALSHPERVDDAALRGFDPVAASPLTFEPVDQDRFPLFAMGVRAGRRGGTAPAAFNAANEEAVSAFLDGRLSFPGMAETVASVLDEVTWRECRTLSDVIETDREARALAERAIASAPNPQQSVSAPGAS